MTGMHRGTAARPLAAVAAALLLATPAPAIAQHAGDAVKVNGVGIANERLDRFLVEYLAQKGRNAEAIRHPGAYRQYRREALDQLIDDELLWQEAARLGMTATKKEVDLAVAEGRARYKTADEFARRLERAGLSEATYPQHAKRQASIQHLLERKVLKGLRVADPEIHAFYSENPDKFTTPEQVHARHILVQADSASSAEERARARATAEEILALLRAGSDFEALARERSQDPSAAQGGDLGWVDRDKMVPEFEAVAFALRDGEVSSLVETVFGFHVIRTEGRRGGEAVPEAMVREEIRKHLLGEKQKAAVRAAIDSLRTKARIEFAEPP
jgi:parvulin-like peptidyl-prolyl isomerase